MTIKAGRAGFDEKCVFACHFHFFVNVCTADISALEMSLRRRCSLPHLPHHHLKDVERKKREKRKMKHRGVRTTGNRRGKTECGRRAEAGGCMRKERRGSSRRGF